jgi:glutamyl-Q tRNA(Asp) synthetase
MNFKDLTKGLMKGQADQLFGDFVVKRTDGYHTYHLATVVDDYNAGVNEIIRGDDLLESTFPQLWLHEKLGLKPPTYAHIPTVKDAKGVKLSKQTGAEVVTPDMASCALSASLKLLGIPAPKSMEGEKSEALLSWGLSQWKTYQSQ